MQYERTHIDCLPSFKFNSLLTLLLNICTLYSVLIASHRAVRTMMRTSPSPGAYPAFQYASRSRSRSSSSKITKEELSLPSSKAF